MVPLTDLEVCERYALTAAEVQSLHKVFAQIDINHDDSLQADELTRAMHILGHSMNQRAIKAVIAAVDKDLDGAVVFDEFAAIVAARIKARAAKDQLADMFNKFDVNRDGFLSPKELHNTWSKTGERISMDEAKVIVAEADENGDGEVSFDEFMRMWKKL